ncbi:CoA transferase [Devosia sp. 66-22]|uniref:CoA transferase n=1 Tax=Devosia sp. 66-22 TaxID=1895753 RepID=UPI00344F4075
MWNSGQEGDPPMASALYVADATAAHMVVEAVLDALLWRHRGGRGGAAAASRRRRSSTL